MKKNITATICILACLMAMAMGCKKSSGSRSFSYNFNSDKEDAPATALKMYDAVCRELESRDFKQSDINVGPEGTSVEYGGQYEGFAVTVKINCLSSISEKDPEFSYRVSFEETSAIARLEEATKALRPLMQGWCDEVL